MVSSTSRYTKRKLGVDEIKSELATIFTYARQEVRDGWLDHKFNTTNDAAKLLIQRVDGIIKGWFSDGRASTRTPAPWIGAPKSNLITLFPFP